MVPRTMHAITEAFNRLIADHDFQKISVDMIMKEARVSRSTFYRYFKDKYEVMNANYKYVLDYYVSPERSKNYRDLCYHLFAYGQENLKIFRRALDSTGFNSFSNFIYEYSYQTALAITRANRNGEGFTPAEELQADVFCNGICAVYRNMVAQRYAIDPSSAADALYEMMPQSLKHYWWPDPATD
ncbi:MAG: TetR family transcriptional regulator [Ruminiclostridium sp.]|nr:TetR family transcriptional regulator [Ruminiclostridium sp.]MBQ9933763.1 TetR family transcriptional regulator [Ruminiclostridium sp.]